jgi:hypothetical protein
VKWKEEKCGKNHLKVQWSEVMCNAVRWNGAVENLNGIKPNERVVKWRWLRFKWEEVKCRQL